MKHFYRIFGFRFLISSFLLFQCSALSVQADEFFYCPSVHLKEGVDLNKYNWPRYVSSDGSPPHPPSHEDLFTVDKNLVVPGFVDLEWLYIDRHHETVIWDDTFPELLAEGTLNLGFVDDSDFSGIALPENGLTIKPLSAGEQAQRNDFSHVRISNSSGKKTMECIYERPFLLSGSTTEINSPTWYSLTYLAEEFDLDKNDISNTRSQLIQLFISFQKQLPEDKDCFYPYNNNLDSHESNHCYSDDSRHCILICK